FAADSIRQQFGTQMPQGGHPPHHSITSSPIFAERDVMEYLAGMLLHSGLMFAERITLPHFSVSSAISLPKSAGEPTSGVPPRSASRSLILRSARPALISLLRFSTISTGVLFGAPTPNQGLAS